MNYCDDFAEVYIRLSNCNLQGFGKRIVLALNDSKSKGGNKIGNVNLESHNQMLEETRKIQNSVQFIGRNKTSKVINNTRI